MQTFKRRIFVFKKLIPDFYYDNITNIDTKKLKEKGIEYIICDLDNTLDSHNQKTPSETALSFLNTLKDEEFTVCIISNGKHERVKQYLEQFPLSYIAKAGKPLKKSYLKAMNEIGAQKNKTAFIGDQIFTDVLGANRVGITTILVTPIESIENPFFYIKRALEKFVLRKIVKE